MRDFGSEEEIVIKDSYNHGNEPDNPSIYIMFDVKFQPHWCYSGNELRRIYLEDPSNYISEPVLVQIPKYLDKKLTDMMDNY